MKTTVVDPDGTVRCPVCGATSFRSQRSMKAKTGGLLTLGVGVLAMPKRLKCNGCGEYLKAASSKATLNDKMRAYVDEHTAANPGDQFATELTVEPGEAAVKGFGCQAALDGDTIEVAFSKMMRSTYSYPAAMRIPLAEVTDVSVKPATIYGNNGIMRVSTGGGKRVELLFAYWQRKAWAEFAEQVEERATVA